MKVLPGALVARPRSGVSDKQLGLAWLVRVRWGAVLLQLVGLAACGVGLGLDLPYPRLLAVVGFTILTNALLLLRGSPERPLQLPVVLVADIGALTLLLAWSGGASNPFTVFFLVHVALAALLLPPSQAWALVLLTVAAFGALFLLPAEPMAHHAHAESGSWSGHLVGMWVAFLLAAAFVAYFVGKVSRAIRERDRSLAELAVLAVQNERLATLSSFSANAAHELGSPLATIGLAAKELALALGSAGTSAALSADAELVCREVARCRDILSDLSSRAGESMGEMPVPTTPTAVLEELSKLLSARAGQQLRVTFSGEEGRTRAIVAPIKTLAQMLHNLIRNAFEAQEESLVDTPIELTVQASSRLSFRVLDRGPGLPAAVRARLGEPFVTSKAERGGLGLGLYLVRAYAERTGGFLASQQRAEGGTEFELSLPLDSLSVVGTK